MIRTILAALGLVSLVTLAAIVVWAGQRPDPPRKAPKWSSVDMTTLDLSTTHGVATVEWHLAHAIRDVCGSNAECRRRAYAGTRAQLATAILRARADAPMILPVTENGVEIGPKRPLGSIEPQLLQLAPEMRGLIDAPLARAFETGATQPWLAWPQRGSVIVSKAAAIAGTQCRNVWITLARPELSEVIASGTRCIVPGLLPRQPDIPPETGLSPRTDLAITTGLNPEKSPIPPPGD